MKHWIVAAFVAVLMTGAATGIVSATTGERTVDVIVVERTADGALYLGTRLPGEEWAFTERLEFANVGTSGVWAWTDAVTVAVPDAVASTDPESLLRAFVGSVASLTGAPLWLTYVLGLLAEWLGFTW